MNREGSEVVSALMLAVLQVYEHRTNAEIWMKMLEPMKALVPCEDAKAVVRSIGAPPMESVDNGPFDPSVRWRTRAVNLVEEWCPQRIEGHAALTQRICRIPSQEAERHHWDQYELGRSNNAGTSTSPKSSSLRCLVAIPLFDAGGNVLAVVKLINRRTWPDGQPSLEFSKNDLTTLSAFSAIFACIVPFPYLDLHGTGLQRRPQARLLLSDRSINALVSWQLPKELRGTLVHEIFYGELDHEDEYAGRQIQDDWKVLACGVLQPMHGPEDGEAKFEYEVPGLLADTAYAFSARFRNLQSSLGWSEPSAKLSTFLVPPHSIGNSVQLFPLSESMVQLEWHPFQTCDDGLTLVEYQVVARTMTRSGIAGSESARPQGGRNAEPESVLPHGPSEEDPTEHGGEQVVATFISDGSKPREIATVANLQSNMTYCFAVEARYPYVGTRCYCRALLSDHFCFPTVDLTLPAPQPIAVGSLSAPGPRPWPEAEAPLPVLVRWPYPQDLSQQLLLQYRTAAIAAEHRNMVSSACPRLNVSTWKTVRAADMLQAQLLRDDVSSDIRVLRDASLEGHLAAQLRVVMIPSGSHASPPSAWFHPGPPNAPENLSSELVANDVDGVAVRLSWQCKPDRLGDTESSERGSREMGPVGYAVRHDFSRGHGPCPTRFQARLRYVSADGNPRGDWVEIVPHLLPSASMPANQLAITRHPALDGPLPSCYSWLLQEQRWFAAPGALFEIQVRHGNQLYWSAWVHGGIIHVNLRPPTPGISDSLQLEDVRTDSVRLQWLPFLSGEPYLQSLEYRILCLELPDGLDARPVCGGRIVSWRVVDVVTSDDHPSDQNVNAPLNYVVRSLSPFRRYLFAIECRYLKLPALLAGASISRLELPEPLACRELRFVVLPDTFSVAVSLTVHSHLDQGRSRGFHLQLQWRFHMQPSTAATPPTLCYQLACMPRAPESTPTPSKVLLPPALLIERGRGGDGMAVFSLDRPHDMLVADVEVPGSAIESLISRLPMRLAVRVGDPSTGTWSLWSEQLSEPISLTLPPPVPAEAAMTLKEELWRSRGMGTPPLHAPHAVEAVVVSWTPFGAAPGTSPEQHALLTLEYEVTVWALDPCTPSMEEVRSALLKPSPSSLHIREAFRQVLTPAVLEAEGCFAHKFRIPGESFQAGKNHHVRITARYLFADGAPVPEPYSLRGPRPSVLLSKEPMRPTPHRLRAPTLEPFPPPHDEGLGRTTLLQLPQPDNTCVADSVEPYTVEWREGCVYAARSDVEPAVVASGHWVKVPPQDMELLPGDRPRVLVKNLQPKVCQFRVHRAGAESEPSAFSDIEVWRPTPAAGASLKMQVLERPRANVTGLSVAMCVNADSTLHARLIWPRHAPEAGALRLERYQVRWRDRLSEWVVLPSVDLPRFEADVAECQVNELRQGGRYEFALRLCNALGRWSEWSAPTVPLLLELPALAAGRFFDQGGLRVAMLSPTTAKLVWRPFSVPIRTEHGMCDPPLVLEEIAAGPGLLMGEYEVLVHEEGGNVVSIMQHDALVMFEEIVLDSEPAWIEIEVQLEPHKGYSFEIHARFRTGPWGPSVWSAPLQPRLTTIGVGTPLAELLLRPVPGEVLKFEAAVHFECAVRGFHGGLAQTMAGNRKAAAISQYQLRSCSCTGSGGESQQLWPGGEQQGGGGGVRWTEWPVAQATSVYSAGEQMMLFDVLLNASPVPLSFGHEYAFAFRCADEFGRWTDWSNMSERIHIVAPLLVPPQEEHNEVGSNLRMTPLGNRAALLEWAQFRPDWQGVNAQEGLNSAIQKVAYRIRLSKRLGSSLGDWVNVPVAEIVSERRSTATLSYEVAELDERFEYHFYVSARWMDLPPPLCVNDWTPEICSALLPVRLQELRAPDSPCTEVVASENGGVAAGVKWCPSLVLRDNRGLPVPGARYQVRHAPVPWGEATSPRSRSSSSTARDLHWRLEPAVQESTEEVVSHETTCLVRGLSAGGAYRFSVRIGDSYKWSDWSPPSDALLLVVQAPMPSAGDVLETTFDTSEIDSVKLEWRPFRAAPGFTRLEYKVMALEWPYEEAPGENSVLARLRRAADLAAAAAGPWPANSRNFRAVGYLSSCGGMPGAGGSHSPQLRQDGDRMQWKTEGLRPGMYYRFFVCARYACLPMGAVAPLPNSPAEPRSVAWPDEHCDRLHGDGVAWEASLSRVGLWSQILSTLHLPQYAVRSGPPPGALTAARPMATTSPGVTTPGDAVAGSGPAQAASTACSTFSAGAAAIAAAAASGPAMAAAAGMGPPSVGEVGACRGGCFSEEWIRGSSSGANYAAAVGSAANAVRGGTFGADLEPSGDGLPHQ